MPPPRSPLYLERETYRRRRLMDAARVLPLAGLVLILLPVLWTRDAAQTAFEAVYLFALWAALVIAAALMARPLRTGMGRDVTRAPAPPAADPGQPASGVVGAAVGAAVGGAAAAPVGAAAVDAPRGPGQ